MFEEIHAIWHSDAPRAFIPEIRVKNPDLVPEFGPTSGDMAAMRHHSFMPNHTARMQLRKLAVM